MWPTLLIAVLGLALYTIGVPGNPPGFYLDESSIAYNAHTVATTGRDEHGEAWPLFFRAFGEYKNPVYVYLLAAVFRLTGPSVFAARLWSALLGVAAALLLGRLAEKMSGRKALGLFVSLSALLTPWLYENSRLVFEVALYPLAVVLFLSALHRASIKEKWMTLDVSSLAVTLALLTYTYSIGRLLAPLLALGLALFATTRARRRGVLLVWLAYGFTLLPLCVFHWRRPGALTERFSQLSYVTSHSAPFDIWRQFVAHYAANLNPLRLLWTGEDNIRDHLPAAECVLAVTFLLAVAGLMVVLRRHRRDPWWRFLLYALFVAVIPASLTMTVFPQIRLIVLPVLLHVFTVPAWQAILRSDKKRARWAFAVAALLLATVAQGASFQWRFHVSAPERGYVFDEKFPRKILAVALSTNRTPIYLFDPPGRSGYIQAYWHGLLAGVDSSRFARLSSAASAPPGSVVISTEEACANCRLLARHLNFIVYTPLPSELRPVVSALPAKGFRAEVTPSDVPDTWRAGERVEINVLVRNVSGATWPSVGADDGSYTMTLSHRWRHGDGSPADAASGRKALFYGLDPGDAAGLTLNVNAPATQGDYILEIDVAQEGVAWFSEGGASVPYRKSVRVIP